jgi:hypothetical protein
MDEKIMASVSAAVSELELNHSLALAEIRMDALHELAGNEPQECKRCEECKECESLSAELAVIKRSFQELEQEAANLATRLTEALNQQQKNTLISGLERELVEASERESSLMEEIGIHGLELTGARADIVEARAELAEERARVQHLAVEKDRLRAELAELANQVEESVAVRTFPLQAEIGRLREELETLKKKQAGSAEEMWMSLAAQAVIHEGEEDDSPLTLADWGMDDNDDDDNSKGKSGKDSLRAQVESLTETLKARDKEVQEKDRLRAELQVELEAVRQRQATMDTSTSENDSLRAQVLSLFETLKARDKEVQEKDRLAVTYTSENGSLRAEVLSLSETLKARDKEFQALTRELEAARQTGAKNLESLRAELTSLLAERDRELQQLRVSAAQPSAPPRGVVRSGSISALGSELKVVISSLAESLRVTLPEGCSPSQASSLLHSAIDAKERQVMATQRDLHERCSAASLSLKEAASAINLIAKACLGAVAAVATANERKPSEVADEVIKRVHTLFDLVNDLAELAAKRNSELNAIKIEARKVPDGSDPKRLAELVNEELNRGKL